MGNENLPPANPKEASLLEELCSLTQRDYPFACRLSRDPFRGQQALYLPSVTQDFPISALVDEAEETQPLRLSPEPQPNSLHPSQGDDVAPEALQKNQNLSKSPRKNKKIAKNNKGSRIGRGKGEAHKGDFSEEDENSNETGVDEGIRDQNNCKSYHKLLKNFLIERGLGALIEQYDKKYHTRYYFIVCLLMVKHRLAVDDFPTIYQGIVEVELAIQQRKIDRKTADLSTIRGKLQSGDSSSGQLRAREGNLQSQIEHIKVVKFQIGNYSLRSCRAFFQQGSMEEALRILYLKNDPVMRKKYYFQEALERLREIQLEMRKNSSHR